MIRKLFSLIVLSALCGAEAVAQQPLELAKRANDYFMAKWSDPSAPTNAKKLRPSNLWTRGVYYEGLMALNSVEPDERYMDYVDRWGTFHKWMPYSSRLTTVDADHQCCAQTYFMRYQMVGGEEKVASMRKNFDNQISDGSVEHWFWIDAIQMAMPAYAMLTQITGDRKYLDYAMRSYLWTRNECGGGLFNKAEGLWWRDKNFVPPYKETDGKNCYWSRGNGWVYAALVRSMNQLPPKSKEYKELKKDFLLMSEALKNCQHEDGFWHVSLVRLAGLCRSRTLRHVAIPLRTVVGYEQRTAQRASVPRCSRPRLAGMRLMRTPRRLPGLRAGLGRPPRIIAAMHLLP